MSSRGLARLAADRARLPHLRDGPGELRLDLPVLQVARPGADDGLEQPAAMGGRVGGRRPRAAPDRRRLVPLPAARGRPAGGDGRPIAGVWLDRRGRRALVCIRPRTGASSSPRSRWPPAPLEGPGTAGWPGAPTSSSNVGRSATTARLKEEKIPRCRKPCPFISRRRDSGPIRVVELSGSSARIGRSASCEVQIADPALAQEQCVLRRRGNGWLLVPVGPPGAVWIDGRPVERGQLLSMDAPFRVGDHWLTLHRSDVPARRMGFVPDPDPGGDAPVARSRLGRPQGRGRGREGTEGPSRTRGITPRGAGPRIGGGTPVALGSPPRAARTLAGGARGGEAMGGALASGRREPPRPFGHADLPPRHLARDPLDRRTETALPPSETSRRPPSDRRAANSRRPPGAPSPSPTHQSHRQPRPWDEFREPLRSPVPLRTLARDPSRRPSPSPRERVPEGRVRVLDPDTETAPPRTRSSVDEVPPPSDVQEPEVADARAIPAAARLLCW